MHVDPTHGCGSTGLCYFSLPETNTLPPQSLLSPWGSRTRSRSLCGPLQSVRSLPNVAHRRRPELLRIYNSCVYGDQSSFALVNCELAVAEA
jgi:hypothetical protein